MQTHTAEDRRKENQLITIPVVPPTDPAQYRATRHYHNRLRERVSEAFQSTLPAKLIREGQVRRLEDAGNIGLSETDGAKIAFTTTGPKNRPWTLIAGLRPMAFTDSEEKHRAVTIYQGTPDQERVQP
jgi:hypothetical protein